MVEYKTSEFSLDEVRQAVNIQIQELPKGFLSSLGSKPLELIFSHAALSKFGVLVLAKEIENNRVIGYVFGATDTSKFYKEFLIKRFFTALIYFFLMLLTMEKIKKAFETLFYPNKKSQNQEEDCKAELLDLAVEKPYHGKEIALNLFGNFVNKCRQLRVSCFDIPTTEGLEQAHRFYEKVGAKKVKTVMIHGEQKTYIYRYRIR